MEKLHVADNNERTSLCGGSGSPWCENDEVCRCEAYETQDNVRISKVGYRMPSGEMEHIPLPDLMARWRTDRAWLAVVAVLGIAFFAVIIGGFIPR